MTENDFKKQPCSALIHVAIEKNGFFSMTEDVWFLVIDHHLHVREFGVRGGGADGKNMREVGCSNPNRNRLKSLRQEVAAPLL